METIATAISWILIAAGSFFVVVGATGLVRMPDVFTRMHAAGILDTVGAGLMLIGMMFAAGLTLVTFKLAIILAIILFTSPVATHALAQAALHAGVEPLAAGKGVLGVPERKPSAKSERSTAERAPAEPVSDDVTNGEAAEPSPKSAVADGADEETAPPSEEAGPSRQKRSVRRRAAARSARRAKRTGRRTARSRGRRRTRPSNS